jgi:hypothetical protein
LQKHRAGLLPHVAELQRDLGEQARRRGVVRQS